MGICMLALLLMAREIPVTALNAWLSLLSCFQITSGLGCRRLLVGCLI